MYLSGTDDFDWSIVGELGKEASRRLTQRRGMPSILLKIADSRAIREVTAYIGGDRAVDLFCCAFDELLSHDKITITRRRHLDRAGTTTGMVIFKILIS